MLKKQEKNEIEWKFFEMSFSSNITKTANCLFRTCQNCVRNAVEITVKSTGFWYGTSVSVFLGWYPYDKHGSFVLLQSFYYPFLKIYIWCKSSCTVPFRSDCAPTKKHIKFIFWTLEYMFWTITQKNGQNLLAISHKICYNTCDSMF